ncbi:MAG: S-layer homology domain-containing protein [Oscillospiraceae bacterium]|nr:S-layer homology domain-containing protein [Oscillospiraceae bacterium]
MKKCISLFLALIMLFALMPAALAVEPGLDNFRKINEYPSGQFTDVKDDAWYLESVKSAYEYGLVKGSSATTFNPEGNMTLAEALALADRLHSIYNTGAADFVQGEPWYQVYADYAMSNGIISSDGFADYNAKATRAQFAQIFARALPESALQKINNISEGMIPDVNGTDSFGPDVYMLYNAGILTGSDVYGTFNPNSNIKRSEVSAIVTRMADASLRKSFTPAERIEVTGITLNKSNEIIDKGGILWISAAVSPDNASDKTVTWTSSDASIASVFNGKVTGLKPGTVTITAAASNGMSASCTVTVKNSDASSDYAGVLQLWKDACAQGSYDAVNNNASFTECNIWAMQDYFLWGHSFYYDCKDINGDGVSELIISYVSYDDNTICGIYSVKDGICYYYLYDYFKAYNVVDTLADGTVYTRHFNYGEESGYDEYIFWRLNEGLDMERVAYFKEYNSSYYDIDGNKLNSGEAIKAISRYIDGERMKFNWKLLSHNYAYDYMDEIEALLITPGVNGMLKTAFTDAKKVDLYEVIYQMSDDNLDYYKVLSAYKKEFDFYDTSLTYMSKAGLDKFLKKYTGFGFGDANWDLTYVNYVKSIDTYCIEHGDTNMQPVYVMDASNDGDIINVVYYPAGGGNWYFYNSVTGNMGNSEYMQLTVKRLGPGSYQLISNLPL